MKRSSAPGRNLADGAGLLQRVLGSGKGDGAGLGRAVEFVDHRPPPFDHRALDVGGTGRGGMDDVAQRRHVVFLADLLRQLHQPDEHGRHHEDGVDLLGLDHAQKFFRVEARHEHQRAAETAGAQAERVRRGMIERPGKQCAGARLEAVDHPAHALRRWRSAPASARSGARPWDGLWCPRCRSCSAAAAPPARHSAGAA